MVVFASSFSGRELLCDHIKRDRLSQTVNTNPSELTTREDGLCYTATLEGNAANVAAYLKRGADIARLTRSSLLTDVAKRGHIEVLRVLLDEGADVNYAWPDTGITPLMEAARHGRLDTMRFLLQRGASIGKTPDERFRTMAWAVRSDNADIVNLLIDEGVEPDACSPDGHSALMMAELDAFPSSACA